VSKQLPLPLRSGKLIAHGYCQNAQMVAPPEQAEFSRLAWAFAISLALHLLIYGGYHTGQKYHPGKTCIGPPGCSRLNSSPN